MFIGVRKSFEGIDSTGWLNSITGKEWAASFLRGFAPQSVTVCGHRGLSTQARFMMQWLIIKDYYG
jgi:hypothetical protein